MAQDASIYLDYNATAPARPEVVEAMVETMALGAINPSSVHGAGREALKRIELARVQVAAMAGAEPSQVVFTGSGTEADNMVLGGCARRRVLVSAVEHSAVLRAALTKAADCDVIPVSADGVVDLDALQEMLRSDDSPALVSVMAANNETGALQPITDVVRIARHHGALVHTDAVQAAGKIAVEFKSWDVDYMCLSAHKIGGPQGVGAVICRDASLLRPLILGGGQERGMRAGTENVAGIVGFGVAAEIAAAKQAREVGRLAGMRNRMEAALRAEAPQITIISEGVERLANTSCLTMPGVRNDTQVMAFDLAGLAVSAGSACSAGKVEPSHVLEAMGVSAGDAITAVRISLGDGTKDTHIDIFITAWLDLWARKGNSRSAA